MKKFLAITVAALFLLTGFAKSKRWGATMLFTGVAAMAPSPLKTANNPGLEPKESNKEVKTFIGKSRTAAIKSATDCAAPGNLTVSNITNSGAAISWTAAGATEFEFGVSTSSAPPESGTLLQDANSEFVSGLSSATYYYLHVRTKCGNLFSTWSTSEPFRTADAPAGLITWVPTGQMDFGHNPLPTTTADSRITVTDLTRGTGVKTTTSGPGSTQAAQDAWGGYGWEGKEDQDIQFTVAATSGYTLSLSSLLLSYRISTTGPASAVLQYAIGNGSFISITTFSFAAGNSAPAVNLSSLQAMQNLSAGSVVRFRILPAAASHASGTFYLFNEGLVVNGTVTSAIPAPVPDPVAITYPTCFTVTWPPVPGASSYFADVYRDTASLDPNRTTVAGWSFKTDLSSNTGIPLNLGKAITTTGASAPGVSSETARAEGWQNGSGSKYWEVSFTTANYYNLKLSSKQRSSNTGPRHFKVQYKIGASGTYTDVQGSAVTVLNDSYSSGAINGLALPDTCQNKAVVFLRWVMTSNLSVDNGTISHLGASNIDDIFITGNQGYATTFVPGYNNRPLGNATSAQITGLTPNTKYYFVVRAAAGENTGNPSTPLTVTTPDYATMAYRSRQSGAWSSAATWDYESGCNNTWTAAPVPPAPTNSVFIQNAHSVTLDLSPVTGTGKTITVENGGTLVTGSNNISGAGSFVLQSGSTLSIGSPEGISATGNTGNIRVTGTRTFHPAARYTYAGTGHQITGTGLPATITGALTIANAGLAPANTVTLTSSTTASQLVLQTPLILNGQSLTIANLSGSGAFTGSKASTLVINGGTFTLRFDQSADTLTNALGSLVVNGGHITLGNKLAIYHLLRVNGGTLDLAGLPFVLKSNGTATAEVAEIKGTLIGATAVTVERFIPKLASRKWRLLTAPVSGPSINASWQEGLTFDNGANRLTGTGTPASPVPGYGTLITGHGQGTAAHANGNGFDFWPLIANAASSLRRYAGAPSSLGAGWTVLPNTTTPGAFDQGQAYLLFVRGDRTVSIPDSGVKATTLRATGTLRQGTRHFTLYGPDVQSHSLIGNPYASSLDFDKVYKANPGLLKRYFWLLNSG